MSIMISSSLVTQLLEKHGFADRFEDLSGTTLFVVILDHARKLEQERALDRLALTRLRAAVWAYLDAPYSCIPEPREALPAALEALLAAVGPR